MVYVLTIYWNNNFAFNNGVIQVFNVKACLSMIKQVESVFGTLNTKTIAIDVSNQLTGILYN